MISGEGRENKPLYFKVVLPGDVIAALRTEIAESDFVTFTITSEGHEAYNKMCEEWEHSKKIIDSLVY